MNNAYYEHNTYTSTTDIHWVGDGMHIGTIYDCTICNPRMCACGSACPCHV